MDGIETYWIWLIIGLALASLELVVPGVYLIWMAMAALAVAVLAFVSVPPLALQIIAWVSLSLIFVFSARRWLRERPIVSSDPLLNNRGGRMVGGKRCIRNDERLGNEIDGKKHRRRPSHHPREVGRRGIARPRKGGAGGERHGKPDPYIGGLFIGDEMRAVAKQRVDEERRDGKQKHGSERAVARAP